MMKQLIKFAFFFLIIVFAVAACQKKFEGLTSHSIVTNNKPPLANAGIDQTIVLPKDSVTLNGSASTDGDGTIKSYRWIKISGQAQSNIVKPDSSITVVKTLVTGVYLFELTVTDNGGISAKDTVQIIIDDPAVNQPPIAKAGADQIITLPTSTTTIDGSGSFDPEGLMLVYSWSQLTGPNQGIITNTSQAVSTVNNLVAGIYLFELKLTDNGGLSAKDTLQVHVIKNAIITNVQLIPVGALSITRADVATATAGNKIFFAGGYIVTNNDRVVFSSRVDIYDVNTQSWTTAELSEGRSAIGVVAVGNKILFAGGANRWDAPFGGYLDYNGESTRVDIYDVTTNRWSTTEMPEGMVFQYMWYSTAVVAGDKAIFCEGISRMAYIYDVITNSWTNAPLSVTRNDFASASLGNKALITGAGGKEVDVFDGATNTWSVHSLSEERGLIRTATLNNKAFFAGGIFSQQFSSKVDIYDNTTQTWFIATLSRPMVLAGAAAEGQKVLFFGEKRIDVYDSISNSWLFADITEYFSDGSVFIGVRGNVYATKGSTVWRVQL